MGSPLGSTLAKFFLGSMEENLFSDKHLDTKPEIYLRYIDDVLAVFKDQDSCSKFYKILNLQHPNIRFTVKKPPKP